VSSEAAFIAALRAIATSSAARGLADDAAVLEIGSSRLVLTMDALVEGVHFLPDDPPETVAWKLVATNVSDLAAKGALPKGCLLAYPLADEDAWDAAFLKGLKAACETFAIPLLGGDTVRQPEGSARSFALVALGEPAPDVAIPDRSGARADDGLWLSGPVGNAGLGLEVLRGRLRPDNESQQALIAAYRTPRPDPLLGVALAPYVSAMMDVSDGVLIDAHRLAEASDVAAHITLDTLPLSPALMRAVGSGVQERIAAASAGDDYCLLMAVPLAEETALLQAAEELGRTLHPIGRIEPGHGLRLSFDGKPVAVPAKLGFEH
jgi:thiamine-monophosphate kinase